MPFPSRPGSLPAFLCFGAVLLGVDAWSEAARADAPDTIVVPEDVVQTLSAGFTRQSGRAPDATERAELIDHWVEQEVLVRRARALGLDRGDLVIRRRLVQKMDFLLDELEPAIPQDDAALQAHLTANADRWARPERRSITQVYLSRDRHGADLQARATDVLHTLNTGAVDLEDAPLQGDPSMQPAHWSARTEAHLQRTFGPDLARAAFTAPPGTWVGPVPSSFGLHLLYVSAVEPAAVPALDDVHDEVRAAVEQDARLAMRTRVVSEWTAAYTVAVGPQ